MGTRSYDELRDSVRAEWSDETRALHAEALEYFGEIARRQHEIGKQVVAARQERHMTQKQLEELSGVGQAEISRVENGHNATGETLIKISMALGRDLRVV